MERSNDDKLNASEVEEELAERKAGATDDTTLSDLEEAESPSVSYSPTRRGTVT
jgi:hypothetical protein